MRQVLGPGTLGRPRGIRWRGRWEGGSGWGIHAIELFEQIVKNDGTTGTGTVFGSSADIWVVQERK